MIPILYNKSANDFNNAGLGFLSDCISCEVTEERNGAFECEITYPVSGNLFDSIEVGCMVKCKPNETATLQLFKIYQIDKPIDGIITIYCEHISYALNGIPCVGVVAKSLSVSDIMSQVLTKSPIKSDFKFWSSISTQGAINRPEPCSIRSLLGGSEGSILDVFGGEYEFDNFTVKLHKNRGNNNGITIEYGKNLTDIKQETNIAECYTHIFPYAKQGEQIITLDGYILALEGAENFGFTNTCIVDLSGEFENNSEVEITQDMLKEVAEKYIKSHDLGKPKISIDVKFIQLWQTEDYKDVAPLERVSLCDTVTVKFAKLGINATAKVIKTVYDCLGERYIEISLGDAKSDFASTIIKAGTNTDNKINNLVDVIQTGLSDGAKALEDAIANATNLITGNSGGYVVFRPAEKPQEILIMDTPDVATAQRVWRWNLSGLGYSSTGVNGEFGLAMTMDGHIVADYVAVGTLDGILLRADSVQANAISQGFKTEINDKISGVKTTVTQEFQVADEQLKSAISKTIEDTKNEVTESTSSLINQTYDTITLEVQNTYSTKTETQSMKSAIEQKYDAINLSVTGRLDGLDGEIDSAVSKINMAVIKDENGKMIGKLDMEANQVSIKSDDFSLENGQIKAGSNGNYAHLWNGGLTFYENNNAVATMTGNRWEGTDKHGTTIAAEDTANYIAFTHHNNGTYWSDITINYGLNDGARVQVGNSLSVDGWCKISETLTVDGDIFVDSSHAIHFGDSYFNAGILVVNDGEIFTRKINCDEISMGGSLTTSGDIWVNNGKAIHFGENYLCSDTLKVKNIQCETISASGDKNRVVDTTKGKRKIYAYETCSPYFGDFGSGETNENGECKIFIDNLFSETVNLQEKYFVFLQSNANGVVWVAEKHKNYFIVKSDKPNIKFDYELKCLQFDGKNKRLEQA